MPDKKRNSRVLSILHNLTVALALLIGSAFLPASARAASTITVTTNADNTNADMFCSLREAVVNSNNDAMTHTDCLVGGSGNDTITFTNGITTITLTSTLPGIADPAGTTINGGGDVTISGNDLSRVFWIETGAILTLNNITISNGKCTNCNGGGVYSSGGSLFVTNSTFSNNQQGISIYGGTISITNSTFTGNYSTYGGAVNSFGPGSVLTIMDSTFSDNSAPNGGGSAVYNGGIMTITNSAIINNTNSGGGAGSIYNDGTESSTIEHSTFLGNSASTGAAIYNNTATLTLANNTFSGNTVLNVGGGVSNVSGTLTIINSTFSGNSAINGGGDVYQYGVSSTVTLDNNILANSSGGGNCVINDGTVAGNNNLIEDASTACGFTNDVNGNIIGSDPKLSALTGSPAYFPLLVGSPAINTGDDTICVSTPVNNTSQNGIPRPQGAHCDMGSYERFVTLTLRSAGAYDGWVLESAENSTLGGTLNTTTTTFNLGDEIGDKQYRTILSFNTAGLPDNAIITRVTLKIKKQGMVGSNPFAILGGLKVDIRKPFFGTTIGLVVSDFQAAAGKSAVGTFGVTPVSNWHSALLNATGRAYVNKTGTTQFRLRFYKGDNDDGSADYMKFYSGNYLYAASRPTLVIEYYVPE